MVKSVHVQGNGQCWGSFFYACSKSFLSSMTINHDLNYFLECFVLSLSVSPICHMPHGERSLNNQIISSFGLNVQGQMIELKAVLFHIHPTEQVN